jgi:hypothetical protein
VTFAKAKGKNATMCIPTAAIATSLHDRIVSEHSLNTALLLLQMAFIASHL